MGKIIHGLALISFTTFFLSGCGGSGGDDDNDDTNPDSFSFTTEIDVGLAELVVSESVEITGINTATDISITGGKYSINGAAFTDEDGEIYDEDILRLQVESSDELYTSTTVTVTVGDDEVSFTARTVEIALTPQSGFKKVLFHWPSVSGAEQYRLMERAGVNDDFVAIGRPLDGAANNFELEIPVHRHDWLGAAYQLEACTYAACSTTDSTTIYNQMRGSIGYIKASNTGAEDKFGIVAISADGATIAVGAPYEDASTTTINGDGGDDSASASGAVYVYAKDENGWQFQSYIKPADTAAGHYFGQAVSLSGDGNLLIIGAPGADNAGGDTALEDTGSVYIFQRFGDSWFQHSKITAETPQSGAEFGSAVAVNTLGATLIIGAPHQNVEMESSVPDAGAAYVYVLNNETWDLQAMLAAPNAEAGSAFGSSLDITSHGNRIIVGSPYESGGSDSLANISEPLEHSGAAYSYTRSAGEWTNEFYFKAENPGVGFQFGQSVAISDDGLSVLIGSPGEASNAIGINGDSSNQSLANSGAAYLFQYGGSNWEQQLYLKASNGDAEDAFGTVVDISGNGELIAVGAPYESSQAEGRHGNEFDNSKPGSGAVYVFEKSSDGEWQDSKYVKAPYTDESDLFGTSLKLDISGDSLVIGAPGEQGTATALTGSATTNGVKNSGAAYLY